MSSVRQIKGESMSRRNVGVFEVFDNGEERKICDVYRTQALDMITRGVAAKYSESPFKLRLLPPTNSASDKRGAIQSRRPSPARVIKLRPGGSRKHCGRGVLLREGRGAGFEDALVARASGRANSETTIAIEAWGIVRGSR